MPLISVWMITRNHEKFVAQAIEGVLMQKTDFPVELVIGEDCSTDGTRAICERYARMNSGRIRLLPTTHHLGMQGNAWRTLDACKGKYIALCEGDDYWNDTHKIEKSVKWMENNSDASFFFHPCRVERYGLSEGAEGVLPPDAKIIGNVHNERFEDSRSLIMWCIVPTVSVMLRRSMLPKFTAEWLEPYARDWHLYFYLGMKGPFGWFNDVMATYRLHSSSEWSSLAVESRKQRTLDSYRFIRTLGKDVYPDEFKGGDVNQLRDYIDDVCLGSGNGKSMQSALAEGIGRIASPFYSPRTLSFLALRALFYKALHARRLDDARRVLHLLAKRHPSILLDRHWVRYLLRR